MNHKAHNGLHVVIPVQIGALQVSVSDGHTQAEHSEQTSDDASTPRSHLHQNQVVDSKSGEVANTPQSAEAGGSNPGPPVSNSGTGAEQADAGLD